MQPLLPAFSSAFGVSPATSSLALSVSTFALAFAMLVAGSLAERWGRKPPMAAALVASSLITLACAGAQSFGELVALRLLEGIALSGLPAVAMAYLGEEVDPSALGLAMGLYVGGTGLGGMFGRLIVGGIADAAGWRAALLAIGASGLVCALLFHLLLPASRNFAPRNLSVRSHAGAFAAHVRDAGLPLLYVVGFVLMGAFVTMYNYLGFRLEAPPYGLNQTQIGAIFTAYLAGVVAAAVMGRLADRFGRRRILWVSVVLMIAGALLTLERPLGAIVLGIVVLTVGFFGAHSTASSWVGRRALTAKAHATSLYLFAYYLGSSIVGSLAGAVYTAAGWNGVVACVVALAVIALLLALGPLRRLTPIGSR